MIYSFNKHEWLYAAWKFHRILFHLETYSSFLHCLCLSASNYLHQMRNARDFMASASTLGHGFLISSHVSLTTLCCSFSPGRDKAIVCCLLFNWGKQQQKGPSLFEPVSQVPVCKFPLRDRMRMSFPLQTQVAQERKTNFMKPKPPVSTRLNNKHFCLLCCREALPLSSKSIN